ncbi:MAG: NAD(P)H-hydrate dehydratase [Acidimicrobiales bacterium]
MIPILTSTEMRTADRRAVSQRGESTLVHLAGTAVALEAKSLLRSCYGARVAVVAGPGLNGSDGRVAGEWLRSRGARVDVIDVNQQPDELHGYELVIDAAFGLGCSRPYRAPRVSATTHVLALDLPSGVDADSGQLLGQPMRATVTVAIGALKPAHLNGPSQSYVGELRYAGLNILDSFVNGLVEDRDLREFVRFETNDHKWVHALHVFAGSPNMPGAAALVLRGALAGGASMIHFTSNGPISKRIALPPEVVFSREGPPGELCRSIVAGPGLGPDAPKWLRRQLANVQVPVILDASGLDRHFLDTVTRNQPWVLTPHEREFERLTGVANMSDHFAAVRELARETNCVVLLKGPTTVIADPTGVIRVVNSGTSALATAGSGDVLAGLIGATLARGHDTLSAAAFSAHLHGRAGARLPFYATASQLPLAITNTIAELYCTTSVNSPPTTPTNR